MLANTILQPWASLIIAGAKPWEFRKASYLDRKSYRGGPEVGDRIVIHAGARPMRLDEIQDVIERIRSGVSALNADVAMPLLVRWVRCLLNGDRPGEIIPHGCGLGTARLGEPKKTPPDRPVADSTRFQHQAWGWPMLDIELWIPPVPMRGRQGFWAWPAPLGAPR